MQSEIVLGDSDHTKNIEIAFATNRWEQAKEDGKIEEAREAWLALMKLKDPEGKYKLGRCDSSLKYRFLPKLSEHDEYEYFNLPISGEVYLHKPTGEEVRLLGTAIDYRERIVRFHMGIVYAERSGYYSDPDSDPFGAIGGHGRGGNYGPSNWNTVNYPTLEAEIPSDCMPWVHNELECMIVTSNNVVKSPVLIANLDGISYMIGSWDDSTNMWSLKAIIAKEHADPKNINYVTGGYQPTAVQLSVAALQGLNIKNIGGNRNEYTLLKKYSEIPSPHHIDDPTFTLEEYLRQKELAARQKKRAEEAELSLRIKAELQERETARRQLLDEACSSAVAEVREKCGDRVLTKILNLDAFRQKHTNAFPLYFPKRIAEVLRLWEGLSTTTNSNTQQEKLAALIAETACLERINIELLDEYLTDVTVKNWGIFARVRVLENGTVYAISTDQIVSQVAIGKSSRALYVSSDHASARFVPSGNWGNEIILDPGEYVMGRDGIWVYEVEFAEGEVSEVKAKTIGRSSFTHENSQHLSPVIETAVPAETIQETERPVIRPHIVGPKRYESLISYLEQTTHDIVVATVLNKGIFQSNSREWTNAFCAAVLIGSDTLTDILLSDDGVQPSESVLQHAAKMVAKDKRSLDGTAVKKDLEAEYEKIQYVAENYSELRAAILEIKNYYGNDLVGFKQLVAEVLANLQKLFPLKNRVEIATYIEELI